MIEEGPSASLYAPLYRLTKKEPGGSLATARDLSGFFVGPGDAKPDRIILHGATLEEGLDSELTNVELLVIDSTGAAIGSYHIGRVRLNLNVEGGDVTASFHGRVCPHPTAGEIWRRWALRWPTSKGAWAAYPPEDHGSWLHVVQNAWFTKGRDAKRYGTEQICTIDGSQIHNPSGFYCSLGEAVNGPGGYFGSTLDGLADCLTSSQGTSSSPSSFSLVWQHASRSRERMGTSFVSFVNSVTDVLTEFDVAVVLR